MQCECIHWARQFHTDKLITQHHPGCKNFKGIDAEVKETIIKNLRYIDNIISAQEFTKYIWLNLIPNFKYDTAVSELPKHIVMPIETALLNKTKNSLNINGVEYTPDKYTFHFSNGIMYNKDDMSYELLVNFIPYPLCDLILIEK